MYFVDQQEINKTIDYFDELVGLYNQLSIQTDIERKALERIVQLMIETVLDTGNMLIDGFIMRDPGSYVDIIYILVDEQVIPESDSKAYEELIALRRMVVVDYKAIDHAYLVELLNKYLSTYTSFSQRVRDFLPQESNVANTFINSQDS